jgi:acetylglutamate kinase
LHTRKLIFLHRPGGIRQEGALMPIVNLTTDWEALSASRELSRKERLIVAEARRLIEAVPHKLLVAVTSPLNLFRELFTLKGAGTLIRRGAVLARREGWDGVDAARLRGLLESAFGRPPVDAFFARTVRHIYLEEAYRGAAVLVETALGSYLSKFAVGTEAQGEGLGRDLWQRLRADHPIVFWRARPDNPIVAWYDKLCDGTVRSSEWHVYWKGLAVESVAAAVAFAHAQPIDIPPAGE